jgi:hypothetical protein
MLARVSNIEAWRRWKHWQPLFDGDEEPTLEDLVRKLTTDAPTAAMMAGTAFHHALEVAQPGEYDQLRADGYVFNLGGGVVELPSVRETRAYRNYGPLIVTGQSDCLHGRRIQDHKTTSRFDAESYLAGCQWRFYLDIFDADVFDWNVFEITETSEKVYRVGEPHKLTAYRYPELHADCEKLAGEFYEFALEHLPADVNRALAA